MLQVSTGTVWRSHDNECTSCERTDIWLTQSGFCLDCVSKETPELTVWVDGGSRRNGSDDQDGYGTFRIVGEGVDEIYTFDFGSVTNNVAEYKTLLAALQALFHRSHNGIRIYMDSALVVNQVNGVWKTKDPTLAQMRPIATNNIAALGATLEWMPRTRIAAMIGH